MSRARELFKIGFFFVVAIRIAWTRRVPIESFGEAAV
jgi:hypothetical protein